MVKKGFLIAKNISYKKFNFEKKEITLESASLNFLN